MINSITTIQLEKLKKIIKFSKDNNEYYKKKFRHVDVENINELTSIPLTSSIDLFKFSKEFKSNISFYKVCASSGTLGNPKLMFRTYEDFESSIFNQIMLMQKSGITRYDKIGIIQPFGFWGYGEITQIASKRIGLEVFPLNDISDNILLDILIDYRINIIDISPSRLKSLIKLGIKTNKIKYLSIKTILSSGEKLEESFIHKVIELLGCKIYNHYGSEETDALGFSEENSSLIYLLSHDFIFEVINDDGYVKGGGIGNLVITSLNLFGTPLIRYEIGDEVKIIDKEKDLIEIIGRSNNGVVLYDSVKLYPFHIETIVQKHLSAVDIWQCEIKEINGVIQLKILIRTDNPICTDVIEQEIANASIDIYELSKGNKIEIEVQKCDDLELSKTGKNKKIIDLR
ncbi:phenylacetate--CoA ligase family protein [Breznakia pachnodae]|uniref:Phenylacetate-CoA ligase n=1 Tax=Breznakia pachnodae TaxID=265178 RepID=A0ABU0E3Q2_9FIRM|nr:AMP-binding protein [Breznakia pachnodae]MDQ0361531.1 phenylacetate-CoA ligase [Breznakia pachnodae]